MHNNEQQFLKCFLTNPEYNLGFKVTLRAKKGVIVCLLTQTLSIPYVFPTAGQRSRSKYRRSVGVARQNDALLCDRSGVDRCFLRAS